METDKYISPLSERYASKEMQYIFSEDKKFSTWRRLWIALAETEMELGLSENGKPVITEDMIDEMKAQDRKSTRLNSSHPTTSRMPSSA